MAKALAKGPQLPDRPAGPESPTTAVGWSPGPGPLVVPPAAAVIGGSEGPGEAVVVKSGAPCVGAGSAVGVVSTSGVGVDFGVAVGVRVGVGVGRGVGAGLGGGFGVAVTRRGHVTYRA